MPEPQPKRKLAAILSTDVVGYSRLMTADEAATVATLKDYRAVMGRVITRHGGRVVNAPGDALLAEFPSAVEAVQCAVEVQQVLTGRNVELPPERRMQVRIGVNVGDVIEEADGTLYGDGVNIAARMEALAEPGGVCISSTVYDAVEGKLVLGFDFLGEQQVKNIAKPVRVYRVRAEPRPPPVPRGVWRRLSPRVRLPVMGAAVLVLLIAASALTWQATRSRAPVEDPVLALPKGPSIAVLPFANLSGDPTQDYFADGITEEIITQLTRFKELFVLARDTTFQYKGRAVDVKKIGRELGVRYVLEGSVRKASDRIRVTAQLIDVTSGTHLWAETYDRALTAASAFGVQDEITEHVVARVAEPYGTISRAGLQEAQRKRTDNLTAYECVLRAREYHAGHVPPLHLLARDCLERAVTLDPNYAEAWAWLSILYIEESVFGVNRRSSPEVSSLRAVEAARRAVALDAASAMAHFSLADVYFFRHELEQFAAEAEQALALNPHNALLLANLGNLFGYIGQLDRSMAMARKAMALNPHHPTWYYATVFNYHYHRREYHEALAAAQKWNDPEFYWSQAHLAQAYAQLGRRKEAQAAVTQLLKLYPDFAKKVRGEYRPWNFTKEMTEHELDGLRKAGLEIPPE